MDAMTFVRAELSEEARVALAAARLDSPAIEDTDLILAARVVVEESMQRGLSDAIEGAERFRRLWHDHGYATDHVEDIGKSMRRVLETWDAEERDAGLSRRELTTPLQRRTDDSDVPNA